MIRTTSITLSSLLAVLLLSGCVRFIDSRANLIPSDKPDPSAKYVGIDAFYRYDREQRARLETLVKQRMKASKNSESTEYKIGAGDTLLLHVLNFVEVSKEYKVSLDGTVNLPFLGRVKAEGKTERQLVKEITRKLGGFLVDPIVTLEVTDFSAHRVWVVQSNRFGANETGPGNSRNAFPLKRPLYPLVELLIEVGDLSVNQGGVIYLYPRVPSKSENVSMLDPKNPFCMKSYRDSESKEARAKACNWQEPKTEAYEQGARIQIDLEELFGGATNRPLYVPLLPGDIVVVPESPTIQVFGEVFQRGGFRASGSNAVGSFIKPTLMSVLAAARGFTYSADIRNIEIFRELEFGKKVVLPVNFEELVQKNTQDVKLRDGDIVWVPSHDSRFYEEHSIGAVNQFLGTSSRLNGGLTGN